MESQKSKDARRIAAAMEAVEVRIVADNRLIALLETSAAIAEASRSASAVDRLIAKLERQRRRRREVR